MTIFNTESKLKIDVVKNLPDLGALVPPIGLKACIRIKNADTGVITNTWIIISENTVLDIAAIKTPDRTTIDKAIEDHINRSPLTRALSNFGPAKQNIMIGGISLPNSIVSKYI